MNKSGAAEPAVSKKRGLSLSWRQLDYLVYVLYGTLVYFSIMFHEPWRDEAVTWLVARDSSFWDAIFVQARYQRHPFIWYLMLFPLAKAGLPYLSQFFLHGLIALASAGIFLFRAPFSRLTKYLFLFTYYMSFQYAVVARHYGPAVFFLFLTASLYQDRWKRPWLYALSIFFLLNSTWMCALSCVALISLFAWEGWREKRFDRRFAAAFAIMGAGLLIAFLQAVHLPVDHEEFGYRMAPNFLAPYNVLSRSLFPLLIDFSGFLAGLFGIAVFVLAVGALLRKPQALFFYLVSLTGLIFIFTFLHPGYVRHFGFSLLQLLVAFWIGESYGDHVWKWKGEYLFRPQWIAMMNRRFWIALNLCLFLSVRYGVLTHIQEFYGDYSGSKATGQYLQKIFKENGLDEFVLVADGPSAAMSVLPYIPGKKIWYANRREFGTFDTFKKVRPEDVGLTNEKVIFRAGKAFGGLDRVVLLLNRPLESETAFGYQFVLLHASRKPAWGFPDERYFLYKPVSGG